MLYTFLNKYCNNLKNKNADKKNNEDTSNDQPNSKFPKKLLSFLKIYLFNISGVINFLILLFSVAYLINWIVNKNNPETYEKIGLFILIALPVLAFISELSPNPAFIVEKIERNEEKRIDAIKKTLEEMDIDNNKIQPIIDLAKNELQNIKSTDILNSRSLVFLKNFLTVFVAPIVSLLIGYLLKELEIKNVANTIYILASVIIVIVVIAIFITILGILFESFKIIKI